MLMKAIDIIRRNNNLRSAYALWTYETSRCALSAGTAEYFLLQMTIDGFRPIGRRRASRSPRQPNGDGLPLNIDRAKPIWRGAAKKDKLGLTKKRPLRHPAGATKPAGTAIKSNALGRGQDVLCEITT
jgi:hypothetical protein